MGKINGLVLRRCCIESLQNNARRVGTSGSTRASRRRNGLGKRTRSCCTWPSWCPLNGALSPPLLGGLPRNAWKDTNTCCKIYTNVIKLDLRLLHNIENCTLDNALFTVWTCSQINSKHSIIRFNKQEILSISSSTKSSCSLTCCIENNLHNIIIIVAIKSLKWT